VQIINNLPVQTFLRKIIKTVANRCHILKLKYPKFELTALSQTPYLDLRGPTSKGREGRKDATKGQRRGEGKEGKRGMDALTVCAPNPYYLQH